MKICINKQIEMLEIGIYRNLLFPLKKWKDVIRKNIIVAPKGYYDRKTNLLGGNYIGRDTFLTESRLGYGSYVVDGSYLAKTEVGRYCSIGAYVRTAVGEHPVRNCVSTSPSLFSAEPANGLSYYIDGNVNEYKFSNEKEGYCITIENDVWIGTGAVLLSGITIHNGAVIGAGSVVTKDAEPYGIYVGNPAKKIGSRFSETNIIKLLEIQWWNKDEKWIIENGFKFQNIDFLAGKNNG